MDEKKLPPKEENYSEWYNQEEESAFNDWVTRTYENIDFQGKDWTDVNPQDVNRLGSLVKNIY